MHETAVIIWKQSAKIAVVAICLLATDSLLGDDLEIKLEEVYLSRKGAKTDFAAVEQRCKELLSEYTKPEEQARIYFMSAHVEGQSGLRHPAKTIGYVKKALSLPLDPEQRLQLYMYWGNALEVTYRGAKSDALKKVRPEVVEPYLKGIAECVGYVAETQMTPLPPIQEAPGPDDRNWNGAREHNYAKSIKLDKLETLQGFQKAFENQIAFVYSRVPFATEEIEKLATQHLPDQSARENVMSKVRKEVEKREDEIRGMQRGHSVF
jgi:hypothetical protein